MADQCKTCSQLQKDLSQALARISELEAALRDQAAAASGQVTSQPDEAARAEDDADVLALRRERDLMADILRGINDLCVAVDRQWRFTYLNPQAERYYGVPASELLGRSAWEAFPPLVGTIFYHTAHRAMEDGETAHFEVAATLRPGRWLEFRTGPTFQGIVFFGTDITVRKQAEQQLTVLNETLEQRVAERTAEALQRAKQLSRLAGELTRTEQRERLRLAEVMHDHLQQSAGGGEV